MLYNFSISKMLRMTKRESRGDENSQAVTLSTKQKLEWQEIKTSSTVIGRRSCHSSCIYQSKLYVYGGYDNSEPGILSDFFCYFLEANKWEAVQQKGDLPGQRHSHVAVVYNDKMYMYGGMYQFMNNTNDLSVFDFKTKTWTFTKTNSTPPPIDSHKCCLYGNQMIVGLGYSQNEYNSQIYSLNLDNLTWTTLFNAKNAPVNSYPSPRSQGVFCLNKDTIVIYGGRNYYDTFSDLWLFDLKTLQYRMIELINQVDGRFGHSAVVNQNKVYIFGGTRGVTHERNDLIVIDLDSSFVRTCWTDSQQQRKKTKQESNQIVKKSRRDSAKKLQSGQSDTLNNQEISPTCHLSPGKYRAQLKDVSYYNTLYDSHKNRKNFKKKTHKNPLLTQIHSSSPCQQGESMNLTSTFQILTNSIMLMQPKSQGKQEKSEHNGADCLRRIPKARDNYSADLWWKGDNMQMIIFGGGMHKIGFNDIIKIDIKAVNKKYLAY